MKREDVLRMAREVGLTVDESLGTPYALLNEKTFFDFNFMLEQFASAIRASTKEEDAKRLDEAADRLLAPKRTNEVDRHTAFILQGHASAIRASK